MDSVIFEDLKREMDSSKVDNGNIILSTGFIDSLLKILGHAVASIENGNVYEAKEMLSEAGELIYQKFKSILVE